jgi:CBS domain containing-hemolysin-like protein
MASGLLENWSLFGEIIEPEPGGAANSYWTYALFLLLAFFLVILNGFFVAAEFALVKVRGTQIDAMLKANRPFAKTVEWLSDRMDSTLSACQLGITMASLGLGWVGEPAFVKLLAPLGRALNIPETMLHAIAFTIAFTIITGLHVIIGEQSPKIFAIRRPEIVIQACAVPLKVFYILTYPLLWVLSISTTALLRLVGLQGSSDHDSPHDEEEIRALIREAHLYGNLTRSEDQLLHGVFEFDDMICRRVMVPRSDVDYLEVNQNLAECVALVRRTRHTRFPLCDGSLDNIIGIVHVKDLVGVKSDQEFDLRRIMRPAKRIPETLPISKLLRHFQATHILMAVVVDEHGTTVGVASLENVLEPIIGSVEDEFDSEPKEIVPEDSGNFIVLGSASIDLVSRTLGINLETENVDTFSGLITEMLGRIPEPGDEVEWPGIVVEVLEVRGSRAERNRVSLTEKQSTVTD